MNLLIDASLVKRENGKYHPTFLIADKEETKKTFHHSEKIGRMISDELMKNFARLNRKFSELEISKAYSIDDLSLVLIGSKILDIGLLEDWGVAIFEILKKSRSTKFIPIILMASQLTSEQLEEIASQLGAEGYIPRLFEFDEVDRKIKKSLTK